MLRFVINFNLKSSVLCLYGLCELRQGEFYKQVIDKQKNRNIR